MNRCTVIDLLEDKYGLNKDELTKRELAIIGLCTNELADDDNEELNLHLVINTMLNTKCDKCNHVFELTYSDHHSPHDTLKIGVGRDADVYEVEVECPKCYNNETVY